MSNSKSNMPIKPLSVGDIVSAGVQIYRSHLKSYLTMTLTAYLWLLIPIYGWAKFAEISGRISRLAFGDLINQPESIPAATQQTSPRKWSFLGAGFLVGLIFLALFIGVAIAVSVVSGVLFVASPPLGILVGLVGVILALIVYVRLASRLIVVELPIAVEDNVDASSAISRSMSLTKGSVGRIQWVVVISFLITLVFNVPVQILSAILPVGENVEPMVALISGLLTVSLSIVSNALIVPFWQVIKAVVYYDLRSRREGYGLSLRN